MASTRDRQRKLARSKLDRQMARRAAATRRRRRVQAGVGATLALVLIVLGSVWALGGFDREPAPQADETCSWTPLNATNDTSLKDVGTPSTTDVPTSGTRPMTITTNQGEPIVVELDLATAPCAGTSFAHLASNNFFDNTTCHEITEEGALRCGDPGGAGQGGPTYSFYNENVPAPADPAASASPTPSPAASPEPESTPATPPAYPAGTVALVGNPPGTNGSQFLIFFKDFAPAEPAYSIVGRVTGDLGVVEKIGALQTMDNGSGAQVKPATDVLIQSLTVGEVTPDGPAPEPAPESAPPTAPAASPTATGQS